MSRLTQQRDERSPGQRDDPSAAHPGPLVATPYGLAEEVALSHVVDEG
ncbi:hypothetical protein [Streptomyces sp. EN16]|nr:hypothetical protein [Streptomyces sp. EN16]